MSAPSEQPVKTIRPVAIPAHFFLFGPPASAFFSLFPAGLLFGVSNAAMGILGKFGDRPVFYPALIAYAVFFVLFMFYFGLKTFREPAETEYSVFEDRIEYAEGFLTRNRRTLIFNNVIDVLLTEGVLQQGQGAGTITLVTQQLVPYGEEGRLTNRQIALHNITEPKENYDLIRSLALKKDELESANRTQE
jgi:hypothetical protein